MTISKNYKAKLLLFLLVISISDCLAQNSNYIAIIPPFHSRQEMARDESPLKLSHQLFVVFVYSNAVAVYSESDFINQSDNFVEQELALPSTGHDENGPEPGGRISNGILSVQLWIQGERVNPGLIVDGSEEWYTVRAKFAPNENRRIKALFWAQTSLADYDSLPGLDTNAIAAGDRAFLINLAHATEWKDVIDSLDVYVILNDGITTEDSSFNAVPSNYNLQDSTLYWSMENIEPTEEDNILVSYNSQSHSVSDTNTMAKLSTFIIKHAYDQLLEFVTQLDEF